jgi:two-component system nitrogen regulation sensor histidine kinase NtrY
MPQPTFQAVNVNELMQQVAKAFQAQARSMPEVECRLELDSNLPSIAADSELLYRCISNLVLNAMDAMPSGGTITLATHYRENDRVHIEVRDTGIGLTAEECDRLFTPYYTTKRHGTGLGLAIVKKIMEDHGGRLGLEDRPRGPGVGDSPAGARAVLTLPWRPAQDRPMAGENDRPDGGMRRAHGA